MKQLYLPPFEPPKDLCPFDNCKSNKEKPALYQGRSPTGIVYSRRMCIDCLTYSVIHHEWSPVPIGGVQ